MVLIDRQALLFIIDNGIADLQGSEWTAHRDTLETVKYDVEQMPAIQPKRGE